MKNKIKEKIKNLEKKSNSSLFTARLALARGNYVQTIKCCYNVENNLEENK